MFTREFTLFHNIVAWYRDYSINHVSLILYMTCIFSIVTACLIIVFNVYSLFVYTFVYTMHLFLIHIIYIHVCISARGNKEHIYMSVVLSPGRKLRLGESELLL